MKISKIACVALLGASFTVSSAFATPQTDYDAAVSAKENAIKANKTSQKEKADAFNNVMTQVKVLQGIKELKDWDFGELLTLFKAISIRIKILSEI